MKLTFKVGLLRNNHWNNWLTLTTGPEAAEVHHRRRTLRNREWSLVSTLRNLDADDAGIDRRCQREDSSRKGLGSLITEADLLWYAFHALSSS